MLAAAPQPGGRRGASCQRSGVHRSEHLSSCKHDLQLSGREGTSHPAVGQVGQEELNDLINHVLQALHDKI